MKKLKKLTKTVKPRMKAQKAAPVNCPCPRCKALLGLRMAQITAGPRGLFGVSSAGTVFVYLGKMGWKPLDMSCCWE